MKDEIIEKVKSFKNLNEYGTPPDDETVNFSIRVVEILHKLNLVDIDVFPGDTGSIFIVPLVDDLSLEIEVQHNNILTMELQKGIGLNYEVLNFWENVSHDLFYKIIKDLSPQVQQAC